MGKKFNSRARKLDLCAKFLAMGNALQQEGDINDCIEITLLGTNLIFLASLALDDNDLDKFSDLVAMFSAKKTLDNLLKDKPIMDMLKGMANEVSLDKMIDDLEQKKDEEDEEI